MSGIIETVQPDHSMMVRTLGMLASDGVIELRALTQRGRKRTDAGYFDVSHHANAAREAQRLNANGAAVYVTLNPVDPQLLGRYSNRIEPHAQATTTDANIVRRTRLLLDFDPVRPKDTSATDAQLEWAREAARRAYALLKELGWADPEVAESGNGMHLIYPLDLPNTPEVTEAVKAVLNALADRLDTDAVKLDRSVFNAARIVKLYGTIANKGDNTPATPWRLSRLVKMPKREGVVTLDQLREIAPTVDLPKRVNGDVYRGQAPFDLDAFLSRLGIEAKRDQHNGGDRYRLARCPFSPEHTNGEAAVFRAADGALGFKCQHNSCADRHWQDVRELVDGPKELRRGPQAGAGVPAVPAHQPPTGNAPNPSADAWPAPLPLPTLPNVPAFDLRLLPDKFTPWVADAAERARFAPDFAAVSAMVAFGSLVGRRLGIRLKAQDDWTEYGNVWGALIGLPSSLKTPAMRDAMSPFKRLQFAADETAAKEALIFAAEFEKAKIRNDAAKKVAKASLADDPGAKLELVLEAMPEAPPSRVYWTSDATVERLGEMLAENPNGLLVERDELSSLLTNLEDERNAAARGFYLTGWSGKEGYRFDRIMRGKTAIPAFAMSVIGGIQPGPLERYVRGAFSGERADGLLQRFQLAVWPDAPAFEYVDRWPSKESKEAAAALFAFADTFDPERIGRQDDFGNSPPYLRLGAGAQGLFVEWYSNFMISRRNRETSGEDCSAVSSHFGKYPGLLGKLALIFHLADQPDGYEVRERTMLKALSWLEYLEPHARRIYHAADAPDADTARLLLARISRGQVQSPFKAREVYRNGWHGLGDAKRVKAACRLLADYDYLRAVETDAPVMGRPSDPAYYVNPKVAS